MAGITISDLGDSAIRTYDMMIKKINNLEARTYKRFKPAKNFRAVGSGFYFGIEMRYDHLGVGANAEDTTLVTPGAPTDVQGYIVTFYQYATMRFTGPAVARVKNGGAFVSDIVGREINNKRMLMLNYVNEQSVRGGDGVITTVNGATTSSTSLVVDSTRMVKNGMTIETSSTITPGTGVVVSNVNKLTKTLTLASAQSCTDGESVYRLNQYNSGTPLEMTGLRQMIDDSTSGTFQNINPSTYVEYRSFVDSDGGAISSARLQKAVNYAEMESGKKTQELRCNRAMRNEIFFLIKPAIIFQGPKNLELTYNPEDDPLSFEGLTFSIDECIHDGELYGLNWDTLDKITNKEMSLESSIPGVGSNWLRVSGRDAADGFLSLYENLRVTDRRANFKFTGLTQSYSF